MVVYRDLAAVLRSAKARGWVRQPMDVRIYAARWVERLRWARQHRDPRFHLLRYEDLVGSPDRVLPEPSAFLGLPALDRRVLGQRVNAPGAGGQGGTYVAPQRLTGIEEAAMLEVAGGLMAELGYGPARRA